MATGKSGWYYREANRTENQLYILSKPSLVARFGAWLAAMLDDRGHSKLFSNVWASLSFVSLTAATNEDNNCFVTRVEFQQCLMKRAKCGDVKPFLLPSQFVWIYRSTTKNTQQVRRSFSLSHNAPNREVKRETVWKHPPPPGRSFQRRQEVQPHRT